MKEVTLLYHRAAVIMEKKNCGSQVDKHIKRKSSIKYTEDAKDADSSI